MNTNLSKPKVLRYAMVFLVFVSFVLFLLLRGTDIRTVGEALSKTSFPFLAAGILTAERCSIWRRGSISASYLRPSVIGLPSGKE